MKYFIIEYFYSYDLNSGISGEWMSASKRKFKTYGEAMKCIDMLDEDKNNQWRIIELHINNIWELPHS